MAQDCSKTRTSQLSSASEAASQPLKIKEPVPQLGWGSTATHCAKVANCPGHGPLKRSSHTQAHCCALPKPHDVSPPTATHNCKHSAEAWQEVACELDGMLPDPPAPPVPPPVAPVPLAMAPPPLPFRAEPPRLEEEVSRDPPPATDSEPPPEPPLELRVPGGGGRPSAPHPPTMKQSDAPPASRATPKGAIRGMI